MVPVGVCVLLDSQAFVDVHFVRLTLATALITWVSDHWADDHMGTVVIRS